MAQNEHSPPPDLGTARVWGGIWEGEVEGQLTAVAREGCVHPAVLVR